MLAFLMWIYPIVWLNLYALILMVTNQIALRFGHPLYQLISGDFLVLLWAVTFLASFLPFFQIKWFRENTLYILAVWFLISAFSLFSTTQGTFKAVFQRAAGREVGADGKYKDQSLLEPKEPREPINEPDLTLTLPELHPALLSLTMVWLI